MESKGRVEGDIGDLSVKMESDLRREGSMKAGESLGLEGEGTECGGTEEGEGKEVIGEVVGREGKFSKVKGGGPLEVMGGN